MVIYILPFSTMECLLRLAIVATCVLLQSPHLTLGQGGGLIEITSGNLLVITGKASARIQCLARGDGREEVNLKWYGPDGHYIGSNFLNRVFTQSLAKSSLSLIFKSTLEQDSGEYTCSGTIDEKLKSAKISVHIDMPLEITEEMAPRSQTLKVDTPGLIKCTAPEGYRILWIRDGNSISQEHPRYSQVTDGLEVSKVNRSLDEGTFYCTVFGTGVASSKRTVIHIKVRVIGPPNIITPPSAGQIVEGNDYRFVCKASGEPSPQYQWFKDESSNELVGERFEVDNQTGVLIIKQSKKYDEGLYRCEARNEAGVDNATALLIVKSLDLDYDYGKNLTSNTSSCQQVLDDLCSPTLLSQSVKRSLDMLKKDLLRLEIKKTEAEIKVLEVQKLKFQEEIELLRLQKEKLRG